MVALHGPFLNRADRRLAIKKMPAAQKVAIKKASA